MTSRRLRFLVYLACLLNFAAAFSSGAADSPYDTNPPFSTGKLKPVKFAGGAAYGPKNPYNIFINYELGMHCVGFDVSYCCVIPPYNSVQAQAVRAGEAGGLPGLLSPEDGFSLYYHIKDNS